MRTSPVIAIFVGTHAPVNNDTNAHVCTSISLIIHIPPRMENDTHHCNPSTWPIFLLRPRREMEVYINRVRDLQRILQPRIRNTQIIRVHLDPAQRKLATLLDNLQPTHSAPNTKHVEKGKTRNENDSRHPGSPSTSASHSQAPRSSPQA